MADKPERRLYLLLVWISILAALTTQFIIVSQRLDQIAKQLNQIEQRCK